MVEYLFYLTLTSFLFSLFLIIISLFGMIFYDIFTKHMKNNMDYNFIEKFIVSFGIGLSIFISYSFIIGAFRNINFFTIYLPFIIIDIFFIVNRIFGNRYNIKGKIKSLYNNFIKREYVTFISILFFVFILQFIFQYNLFIYNTSLISTDPFLYVARINELLEINYLDHFGPSYPPGFRIFCASCLMPIMTSNIELTYFFLKFMPIPLFSFYILIIALILKKLFKKNYLILVGLLTVLTSHYLIYRFNHFLPSNLGTLLLLISFFLFLSDYPKYLIGLFIPSIFFFNPLNAFFYVIILAIFFLIKSFNIKRKRFKSIPKETIYFCLLVLILIIPYIFFIYSYNFTLFDLFSFYTDNYFQLDSHKLSSNNVIILANLIDIKKTITTNWIPNDHLWLKNLFLNNQIIYSFFFIFSVMGLFISTKKNVNKKHSDLIIIGKIIVVITLIIFFLPIFYPNNFIINFFPFWVYVRTLEFFASSIIIMECYFLSFIIKKHNYLVAIFKSKIRNRKNISYSFFKSKIKIDGILIIIIIGSAYSNYYINMQNSKYPWTAGYIFNNDDIDMMFYINENISTESVILVPNFTLNPSFNCIYYLLYKYSEISEMLWDFSINDSYNKTKIYISLQDIDYFLIYIGLIQINQLNNFLNDTNFEIVYQKNNFGILFKVN